MLEQITLKVNGKSYELHVDAETPLLYVLRDNLNLKSPKYGCGLEQCGSCKVLINGADVPSCQIPVKQVVGLEIMTLEGLGSSEALHPLQEAFLEEQAAQCGFCTSGMIITAQGLLNRVRYPSDEDINQAYANNLCRCGVYNRIRRAIKLRTGRFDDSPIYTVENQPPLAEFQQASQLPNSLQATPELDAWVRVNADKTITIFSGKVEIGQGIKTALAQIAAEELDVSVARIQVVSGDTNQTPDEGITAGSMSVETSGLALRFASAEARHVLLTMAHEELEAESPLTELLVEDGTITDPATGRQTTYWTLIGGKRFGHKISGNIQLKDPRTYQVVGQSTKRIDLPAKFTGQQSYVHDLEVDAHARVVRPLNYHARLVSVDDSQVKQLAGVRAVVRDGSFLAVVTETEAQAIQAAQMLAENANWEQISQLPEHENLYDTMISSPAESALVVAGTAVEDEIPVINPPTDAAQTLKATFLRPYHMHASIGPSAAVAIWHNEQLTVWSHSQGVFLLKDTIAQVLNIEAANVHVIHTEGAGCYGHNGADDVALDAALVARVVPNRRVLLKWMREDEHKWEPYSSAMVMKMNASLDASGTVIDWNHDIWSYTHSIRPRLSNEGSGLLAAWHLGNPIPPPPIQFGRGKEFGGHRNATALYAFNKQRVVHHFLADSPLRVSAMRGLGAYANVFAIDSFMDELAFAAGIDPVAFRLNHLQNERAKAVLQAAAQKANWRQRTQPANNGYGQGIAIAQYKNRQCYAAIVVDVYVDRESGAIQLKRVVIAADAGQVVNPDGLSNQLEGGFVQAASWTLFEEVTYNQNGITSVDWDTYPILKMADTPEIEVIILDRPDQPFLGSGEATQPPTPVAIANAIYDAIGVRLREIPFTPKRVLQELK
jgi:nicotinate dehydrogenase subunit B